MEAHRTRSASRTNAQSRVFSFATAVLLFATVVPAFGGEFILDGVGGSSGWKASWDASLDPFVDIIVDLVTPGAVFIQKSAQFTQGPGPGGFPTIPITFTQLVPGAVGQIVFNDEIITNSTGVDWTDFHFEILNSGDAVFNPALTNASAGGAGFTTAPLTNQMFAPDNLSFWVDGFGLGVGGSDAVIPNGTQWFPGDGAFDGELYIDVVTKAAAPFTVFTLKETPTVPEPATLGLLAFGAFLLLARRR